MKNDREKLEKLLHQRLRALPDLRAPEELIPNVLQRIAAQKPDPWWTLPWLQWPRTPQVLSSAFLAALVAAACFLRAGIFSMFQASDGGLHGAPGFFRQFWTAAQTLSNVLERLIASLHFPWLTLAAIVVFALYLSVIGVGAVFYRLLAIQQVASK
jgi:hypothetical protein